MCALATRGEPSEAQGGTKEAREQRRTKPAQNECLARVLVVSRIDRLARSIADLQDIVRTLKAGGATLKATEQSIDTSIAAGKCFLDMFGVFAEFETNLRRERQLEGLVDDHKSRRITYTTEDDTRIMIDVERGRLTLSGRGSCTCSELVGMARQYRFTVTGPSRLLLTSA